MIASGYALFIKNNNILLLRRKNTGFMDGMYGLPAGHIEENEPLREGTCREIREEVGVSLTPNDITLVHIMHRKGADIRLDFFFMINQWSTEPTNCEVNLCDDLQWFPLNSLPENTIPYIRTAIQQVVEQRLYSEYGWEK